MKSNLSISVAVTLLGLAFNLQAVDLDPLVPRFVESYCTKCHADDVSKGDRNFVPFLKTPQSPNHHLALEEILDQLNLGEMPPDKKKVLQPSDDERRAVVDAITGYLLSTKAAAPPTDRGLRRLTRYEYKNTIRDLLGIDPEINDVTSAFPDESTQHGFVNVRESQVISEQLLDRYLDAAHVYVDQALVFGTKKPKQQRRLIRPSEFTKNTAGAAKVAYRALALDGSYVDIGHGEPADRRPSAPRSLARGLPEAGTYRIRVKAAGMGRLDHGYDPNILKINTSQPIKLGVWFARNPLSLEKTTTRGRHLIDVFSLKDSEAGIYEASTWMPQGAVPFFNWINGSGAAKGPVRRVIEHYHPEADRLSPTEVDSMREKGIEISDKEVAAHNRGIVTVASVYRGPRLRLFVIEIEGPIVTTWPPANHIALVGPTTNASEVDIISSMTRFATRAFRRPVNESEIGHHITFVKQAIEEGDDPAEAITLGFSSLLTSPHFLYLDEGDPEADAFLSPYQLASRLSYFLWSTMPDETLLSLAAANQLQSDQQILAQVDRMLDDPRAEAFSRHFSEGWLRLDKLGTMPPGPKHFPSYLKRRLENAMREETRMLVSHVLKTNRPITDFIDADYTFVNDNLAEHYGIPGVVGESFRKIALPPQTNRRGLTGHASVLTASANGVETSPVVRGVWILESLLGTPPSPPPPDVPPIEPDTRGVTTIRQQLAKHRQNSACADCHAKIDPWGFALEGYDPIGGRRAHYPPSDKRGKGPAIDLSATLPSGELISNEADLRASLVKRKDLVLRNLIRNLLTFGVSRKTHFSDQEEIETIAEVVAHRGYKMRDLVSMVATSDIFKSR